MFAADCGRITGDSDLIGLRKSRRRLTLNTLSAFSCRGAFHDGFRLEEGLRLGDYCFYAPNKLRVAIRASGFKKVLDLDKQLVDGGVLSREF